jgi:hypothetical protein
MLVAFHVEFKRATPGDPPKYSPLLYATKHHLVEFG